MSECLIVKGSGETDLPIVHIVHSLEEARHAVLSLMYSNPDDAEDTDELFAEFDDTMADDNYWTIAFEIGGISVERVCLAAPTQGADAQTFVGKWRDVIKNMPDTYARGADTRPVAIYQIAFSDEDGWCDTYQKIYESHPEHMRRIVYAAPVVPPMTNAMPVAEVGENLVFILRNQDNGERWPAGTKLYATRDASSSGWKLAMRVLQSDLYATLDDAERAECDALIRANPYSAAIAPREKT